MIEDGCVDLLYLACNRLEFTQETFLTMLATTEWRYVHELFVYDDGSQDGTREWLEYNVSKVPAAARIVKTKFGSPVTAMVHFIESARAPILAKADNDTMLPPGWLRQSVEVLERHPELTLLGIEAMFPHIDDPQLVRSYVPAKFISGLGLYRRDAFARSRPKAHQKWFGLEEWQMAQGAGLTRGWITPAIPVFLLDRFPFAPWSTYADTYIRCGWQRTWPKYDPTCTLWHWRWPAPTPPSPTDAGHLIPKSSETCPFQDRGSVSRNTHSVGSEAPTFKVVILSARAHNLVPCVRSVMANEPTLPSDHIVVVDDGVQREAKEQLPSIQWVPGIKPFIYSRNANLGIRQAGTDVILLNDDARLSTSRGFTLLSHQVQSRSSAGIYSAGIRGAVGNPRQVASEPAQFRLESRMLAFVCVYIPKVVYDRVGPLDERFIGYGFEDNDYCTRVLQAGLQLGIWDGCVVEHGGELSSTFRTRPDIHMLFRQNELLFRSKWGRHA